MEYKDLKDLIKHVKTNIKCPGCSKRFMDKDLNVAAVMETEAIFQLACSKCAQSMIVNVSINPPYENGTLITINDIIDMHNFLDKFNGDFKKLFK